MPSLPDLKQPTTNNTSPLKGLRFNAESNLNPTLEEARRELRETMKSKMAVISYDTFTEKFLKPVKGKARETNVFNQPPPMKTERDMYVWIVSEVYHFDASRHC